MKKFTPELLDRLDKEFNAKHEHEAKSVPMQKRLVMQCYNCQSLSPVKESDHNNVCSCSNCGKYMKPYNPEV